MLIINQKKEYDFIPVSERGQDEPFTVVLQPLGVRQMAKLEDGYVLIHNDSSAQSQGSISLNQGSYNTRALKAGIVSWRNLKDGAGVDYPARKSGNGEVLDESLNLLPPAVLTEIANVIVAISKYPEDADTLVGTAVEEEVEEVIKDTKPSKPKAAAK